MTNREMQFCLEYLNNGYVAVDAYMKVFPNCTKKSAEKNAYRLMRKQEIKDFIAARLKEIYEDKMITAESIALELIEIARDKETATKDRLKALELLQKQLGLQTQKVEQTGTTIVEINIE